MAYELLSQSRKHNKLANTHANKRANKDGGGRGGGGWEGGTWGRKFFSKKISGEYAYQGPKRRILNLCNFIFRSY